MYWSFLEVDDSKRLMLDKVALCSLQLEQLQALQPLAEDPAAAAQDASEADQQVMAARAEQQRTVSDPWGSQASKPCG